MNLHIPLFQNCHFWYDHSITLLFFGEVGLLLVPVLFTNMLDKSINCNW